MCQNKRIEIYGNYVNDFEVSPFESMYMLHIRSKVESEMNELTNDERKKLRNYDRQLMKNAKKMAEHIGEIYDWSISKEPLTEWWWHLDKVGKEE
ncbi:hypothetical protein [Aneurinibacillus tyrosinisolvens]|uniref:hypothetical protein n=1 Tax=Aneurinibacillus tyrosinisolvens TaxID=1443435 RepID=UPI00063F537B|nr:hypothetical protein [Aneurinibacillus tyrosinisolvens]